MGKKIDQLDVYDDVNTDKSRRDLFEVSKNTGTYASPTYATDGSRKISVEQLKETLFIKEINNYNSVTTGSPTFDKQSYNGIGNSGTYTLPTSTGKYEVLAIIIEGSLSVTVTGLGGGYGDLVFTKQNETAYLIDTQYGWYPLAVNKEINSSAFELLVNKVNSVIGNESNTTKYTSTKAVADYISHFDTNSLIPRFDLKANLNSPSLTGIPRAPTAVQGGAESNTTQIATTAFVTSAIGAIPIPTIATVTTAGNTTTNGITIGSLVVNYPSGSGVATEITKGGNGEALTVTKTSGSGNVASFTGGKTLISELDLTTPLADSEIASASTWNAKLGGTITNNTLPKGNGAGGLVDSIITENAGVVTIAGGFVSSAITGGTVNANNILRTPVLATDTVTVLNGSLWYNTASNLFKGFVNGIVVTFMTSRMPANTIKANNTGSTADAVDLALTTETVLGRTASVNSGNISPIPLQASISAETTLVAGTRTITDSRVTANTIVMVSPSNTGTLTQQIRYTKNVGTSIVFTAGGSDTCTFSYWIIF